MTIGEKIRTLRTESHLTQEALANQLGISSQAVSKWEQNITAPDISLLPQIADIFAVTTDELLGAGRHKTAAGYKNYRARLLAIYEEGGTESDFQKAKDAYADVILHGDPDTEDYLMYGYLYNCRIRRDIDMAMRYYEKALEHGKETRGQRWFQAHQQITLLQCMLGNGAQVVERWKNWFHDEPENIQACLSVIWAFVHSGQAENALPYLEKAEQLAPDDASVMIAIGDVLGGEHGLGRYREAISYWDRAIMRNDDYADPHFSKAYAYEQMGEYQSAIEEYQNICKWLQEKGYDTGVETRFPEEKIRELTNKCIQQK
jgi:transcriptional regulator with XRE-family HTH domain